jgi:hypothetical protein
MPFANRYFVGHVQNRIFTAVFHAPTRAGHLGNIKMPYQTEQNKSPLAPLYERGVKQEDTKASPS